MQDTIDALATIKRREMILEQRTKLSKRKTRNGYLLAALFAALALMCGVQLYTQSHPKAPTYSHEDRTALDRLVRSLQ
jgi:hypothetical protein